ncbi:MAG: hypothetical protein HDT37_01165 [Clostridiales bacterium]|nr:hypothetical protein [Clostridiales bacterium]
MYELDLRTLPNYGILFKKDRAVTAMCAKKKASPNKAWKLAGKLCSAALTVMPQNKIVEYG